MSAWILTHLLQSSLAFSYTINIYTTSPRGGGGDVYANYAMARMLHRQNPDWTINLLVSDQALERMAVFEPRSVRNAGDTVIDGVHFVRVSAGNPPRADFLLQLAVSFRESVPESVRRSAPVLLQLEELEGGFAGSVTVNQQGAQIIRQVGISSTSDLGAEAVPGYYVDAERPPTLTRSQVLNHVRDVLTLPPFRSEDLYTFGYSSRNGQQMNSSVYPYIHLIGEMARLPPNNHRTVRVFINEDLPADLRATLPENVRIHRYSSLPVQVIDSLMAHADLPVLATGDGSVSQAINNEALFLYEMMLWKTGIPSNLRRHIFAGMEPRYRDLLAQIWSLIPNTTTTPWNSGTHGDGTPVARSSPSEEYFRNIRRWAQILSEPEFSRQFRNAIREHRSVLSLPRNLAHLIDGIAGSYAYRTLNDHLNPANSAHPTQLSEDNLRAVREGIERSMRDGRAHFESEVAWARNIRGNRCSLRGKMIEVMHLPLQGPGTTN